MKWKEIWEKYQTAIAFAEAGEFDTARRSLEEAPRVRTREHEKTVAQLSEERDLVGHGLAAR